MKKVTIFLAAICMIISLSAQKKQGIIKNTQFAKKHSYADVNENAPLKNSSIISGNVFATSLNGFTLLSGKKLSADQQTKTILYTHRGGGLYGNSGNTINWSFSTNGGTSFDTILYSNGMSKRYPGGTLVRNADGLYAVCSGPITESSVWTKNYIASAKMDKTNRRDTIISNNSNIIGMFHLGEDIIGLPTGELFLLGKKNGPSPDYVNLSFTIFHYKWNDTDKKYNLKDSTEFNPLLSEDPPPVQPFSMAFSSNGSVGYFWTNGMDSITRPTYRMQPLVWKTIDKGATWTQMPIYDYSKAEGIKDIIWSTLNNDTVFTPVFGYGYTSSEKSMPGTVDKDGNLHLFVSVQGAFSNHPDSLGYTFLHEPSSLVDLYTKANGEWGAYFVDTLATEVYIDGTIFGDWELDHRLHISKTEDGNKIFYLWTDSDNSQVETNILPNLKGHGRNLTTLLKTNVKNFSATTSLEADIFYMNASDITLFDNNINKIPIVSITSATMNPDNEIRHRFVNGVEFLESDFVNNPGVRNIDNNVASISQNYPNPASDKTYIDITLTKNSNISLEVVNLMGQVVYTQNYGTLNVGIHTISFATKDLNSGIYFYNVKAGNSIYNKKMIIK